MGYRKPTPCPLCEHRHEHKKACHEQECRCPGKHAWHDWVAVELALNGKRDKIGRPLTHAEKFDVAQRLIRDGGTAHQIAHATGASGQYVKDIIATIEENHRAGRDHATQ